MSDFRFQKRVFSIALLGCMCVAPTAARAALYSIQGSAYALTSLNGEHIDSQDSGQIQASSVTESASASDAYLGASAHGESTITLNFGAIHSYVYATSQFSVSANSDGYAKTTAAYTDILTITSATLAPGTPVVLDASAALHYQYAAPDGYTTIDYSVDALSNNLDDLPIDVFQFRSDLGVPDPLPGSYLLNAVVGGTINLSVSFSSVTDAQNATGYVDASNTATLSFVPVTAGASFESASGASYEVVPEPASLFLASGSLLLLFTRRRRSTRGK